MRPEPPDPWRAFLRDLDRAVPGPVLLHCLGGFVMTARYGMPRPTADMDVLAVIPRDNLSTSRTRCRSTSQCCGSVTRRNCARTSGIQRGKI